MINILFEDNHILVIEKPINVLVQADKSNDEDLLTILKRYLKEKYNKPGNVYLGLVHRLDRVVDGVMVLAKTSKAAARLSKQVTNKQFQKIYYAVVEGDLKTKGRLENYLVKDEKTNKSFVREKGKLAILDYQVLNKRKNYNLVKINLKTGRHHQIRVQFSYIGAPLFGDAKYNKNYKKGEQIALFAKELTFFHPVTREALTFSLELPKRFPFTIFS